MEDKYIKLSEKFVESMKYLSHNAYLKCGLEAQPHFDVVRSALSDALPIDELKRNGK